jgi:hypothetical protein
MNGPDRRFHVDRSIRPARSSRARSHSKHLGLQPVLDLKKTRICSGKNDLK